MIHTGFWPIIRCSAPALRLRAAVIWVTWGVSPSSFMAVMAAARVSGAMAVTHRRAAGFLAMAH